MGISKVECRRYPSVLLRSTLRQKMRAGTVASVAESFRSASRNEQRVKTLSAALGSIPVSEVRRLFPSFADERSGTPRGLGSDLKQIMRHLDRPAWYAELFADSSFDAGWIVLATKFNVNFSSEPYIGAARVAAILAEPAMPADRATEIVSNILTQRQETVNGSMDYVGDILEGIASSNAEKAAQIRQGLINMWRGLYLDRESHARGFFYRADGEVRNVPWKIKPT